jgi:protein-disulfide isomerase
MNEDSNNSTERADEVTSSPSTQSGATAAPQMSWKQNSGIPFAIVIAAVLIAGAIYLDGDRRGGTSGVNVNDTIAGAQNNQDTPEPPAPVTKDDHIRGNPNAPIMIIEYSDYDCPYCRIFHETMTKVMADFGSTGKVAWVYRHFPLVQLHPNAPKISEGAYCVAELGGNEAFWKYTDALNDSRKVTYDENGNLKGVEPTDMTKITSFATAAGVDKSKFELCYNSGKYTEKVTADVAAAAKTGARGTPYSIVVVGDQQGVINGAQPYEVVKGIVDNLIKQLDGKPAQ